MITKTDPAVPLGYEMHIRSPEFEQEFKDLRVLIVVLRDHKWEDISAAAALVLDNYDKVIIDVISEAPPYDFWSKMIVRDPQWQTAVDNNKVMILDSSPCDIPGFEHEYYPTFLGNWFYKPEDTTTPLLATDRTMHFLSLARIPRLQRVILTQEYYRRKIDHQGIISCGCDDEPDVWNSEIYIDSNLKHKFPVLLDQGKLSREGSWRQSTDSQFMTPLINVVIESSYDAMPFVEDKCRLIKTRQFWDKLFFTEKTNKAFAFHQIPVFLTVPGYVKMLKSWGFDVFDDVVDHSYDTEPDPWLRIYKVASEVERLCSIPLAELASTHNIEQRFAHNQQHLLTMYNYFYNKCTDSIDNFLRK
jgi:hypothetical protein